jgi:uncharacterized membrane protein
MNPAHVHLLVNHIPVLGVVLGLVVLAGAVLRSHALLTRCALAVFVVAALAAIPTYLSGEPAEEIVERAAGEIETWVEPHEEAASVALALVEALGVLALIGLRLSRNGRALPRALMGVTLVAAVLATGSLAWTANLGGQIRHTEIRSGPAAPSPIAAEL